MIERHGLGLPVWGAAAWRGSLYTQDAGSAVRLTQYGSVFNAVEGNATFYAIPTPARLEGWAGQTPRGFGFSFKFPRAITHERRLVDAASETTMFVRALEVARERLGPTMLQLPPSFGPRAMPSLARYLAELPDWLDVAVELRHPALFEGREASAANRLLADHGADRVVLDRRALNASGVDDEATREARRKKPDLPVPDDMPGAQPVLRYIADPVLPANDARLAHWADRFADWIAQGRRPVMFVHLPGDTGAPQLARTWHAMLSARGAPVGEMPPWPGEQEDVVVQPSLFDED